MSSQTHGTGAPYNGESELLLKEPGEATKHTPEVDSLTWNRKRKGTHSRGGTRDTDEIGYVLAVSQHLTDMVKATRPEPQCPGDLKPSLRGKPTKGSWRGVGPPSRMALLITPHVKSRDEVSLRHPEW